MTQSDRVELFDEARVDVSIRPGSGRLWWLVSTSQSDRAVFAEAPVDAPIRQGGVFFAVAHVDVPIRLGKVE